MQKELAHGLDTQFDGRDVISQHVQPGPGNVPTGECVIHLAASIATATPF